MPTMIRGYRVEHRKGEEPRRYFRSTREAIDVGPYRTREAADAAAKRLADMLHDVTDPVMARRLVEHFKPAKDPWSGQPKR
jgi:hypothetical protein